MSLYNALFGTNPLAGPLLSILGLDTAACGRFRDCYPKREPGAAPTIVVFTRCGGGNRSSYQEVFDRLSAHPMYLRDWDDDFDSTYASIEFRTPPLAEPIVNVMLDVLESAAGGEPLRDPMQRFRDLNAKLAAGDETDPEVQRALEVGKGIFSKLEAAMKEGGGGIVDV